MKLLTRTQWAIIAVVVLTLAVWGATSMMSPSVEAQDLPPCPNPTPIPPSHGDPTPVPCDPGTSDQDGAGGATGGSGGASGTATSSTSGPYGEPSIPSFSLENVCFKQADGTMDCPWQSSSSTSTGASGASNPNNPRYAWATHYLTCEPNCPTTVTEGIKKIEVNLSTREPRIKTHRGSQVGNWRNYHYFNRLHLSHPSVSVTCPNGNQFDEFLGVGFAKGRFPGYLDFNNEIVVEAYHNKKVSSTSTVAVCQALKTGIRPTDPTALTFKAEYDDSVISSDWYGQGAWKISIWYGGRWKTLAYIPMSWDLAPAAEYGQEIWAYRNDTQNIIAPLNFGHKANLLDHNDVYAPWHDHALPSHLTGKSDTNTDSPFSVTDILDGDWTSIASCVPVNNKCE